MRGVALSYLSVLLGMTASGCALRDPFVTMSGVEKSGDWVIEKQVDRVTGAPIPSASLVGRASNSGIDYWAKPGVLQLTCFGGKPIVRFGFEFKVGTSDNSFVGYRFDDKPGREIVPNARFQQEYRMVVLDDRADVVQFIADLRGSNALYVRIRSLNAGRTSLDLPKLEGSDAAIDAAYANCPLYVDAPAPAKKKVS